MWQSADPILSSYLDGEGNGGVQNPFNLSLYTYSYQNPVKFYDPDGNYSKAFAKGFASSLLNDAIRSYTVFACAVCLAVSDTVNAANFASSAINDPVETFNSLQTVQDVKALGGENEASRDEAAGRLTYGVIKTLALLKLAGIGDNKPVGKMSMAGKEHSVTGVKFDAKGFPDFSKHLYRGGKNDVNIKPTGTRAGDKNAANLKAGYDKTPEGYVWHHHQNKGRMQLVEEHAHSKTGHDGGFKIWYGKDN